MASVTINTGPIEATQWLDEIPRDQWRLLLGARRSFVRTRLPYDCRQLVKFVEDAEQMYAELGYSDVPDLIRRGLEIDPEIVEWAISGLRSLDPDEPVTLERAVSLGKRGGQPGNRNAAKESAEPAQGNEGDNDNLRFRGTSRDYITARLVRDGHSEDAQAVQEGRSSANAMAVKHGWRKPPPGPVDAAMAKVRRMSPEELYSFEERFNEFLQGRPRQ